MGAFKSAVITKKGQALLAKVIAGETEFNFTKIALSENVLSGDLPSLTGIGTIKQSAKISSIKRLNEANVKVATSFSNEKLVDGYYIRNIGLYATDPQEGEICYSISVADESAATADWMPPFNGIGLSSLMVELVTAVSNASQVTVEVDPTAMATVAQVIALQEELDGVKFYVGYGYEGTYGVEVDFPNNKIKRIADNEGLTAGADFDNLAPWARKRCILADDGTVLAYYGESAYTETGKLTTAVTKGGKSYPVGTDVQVMVEQNLFYVKAVPVSIIDAPTGRGKQYNKVRFYISPEPRDGFIPMQGFKDANGVLQNKIYLAAYEGVPYDPATSAYISDNSGEADPNTAKFSSIADVEPYRYITRAQTRQMANNRGVGWQLHNIFAASVSQWLILIEYASYDCQAKIGKGVCSASTAVTTGATSSLGNGSSIPTEEDTGTTSVSYRGEENLWGNVWTWLDAINIYNTKNPNDSAIYLKEYGTYTDDTSEGYTRLAFNPVQSSGYQSALGADLAFPAISLPTELYGSETSGLAAYFYNSQTGWRIALLGGSWNGGALCSAWYSYLNFASSYSGGHIGGRLLYVPQGTHNEDDEAA